MEEDLEQRSGAQSRVSSAASSHVNGEEDEAAEVKASPTSLVSFCSRPCVFCPCKTHLIYSCVAEQNVLLSLLEYVLVIRCKQACSSAEFI